jgi:CRP-like cAMP-binding protein
VHPVTGSLATDNNRLLGALASDELAQITPNLERVSLHAHQVLAFPDEPPRYVYFPGDAVVTLLVPMQNGMAVEGATIGNEGLVGLAIFLGDAAPSEEMVVQIGGEAARMRAADFRSAVAHSVALQIQLQRYTLALINQLGRTAGCNRLHSVEERSARWLMMSRDRVGRETFPLTHESLADMLGVRRASVTEAAGKLHRAGIIDYRRGWISIVDSAGLEAVACEDYQVSREAYDRLYEPHATDGRRDAHYAVPVLRS